MSNHLFILNGIIQGTLNSIRVNPINLIVADFQQFFDGLSLPLSCKYLFIYSCNDYNLSLLYTYHIIALDITQHRFVLGSKYV